MNIKTLKDSLSLFHVVTYYPIFLLDNNYEIIDSPQHFFKLPKDYFVEIVKEKYDEKYKFMTKFNRTEFYTFLPYQDDNISIIMIGPLLYHKPYYESEIYDNDFLNSLNIYPRSIETLNKIPHSTYRYFAFIQLLYQLLYNEELDLSYLFESFKNKKEDVQDFETFHSLKHLQREVDAIAYPYHLEKQLMYHISKGESTRARTIANDILKTGKIDIANIIPLTSHKYSFAQATILFRKAIVDVGVDIESAFALGNIYIEKMDKCQDEQELYDIYMSMIIDFSTLAKKRRFHDYPSWVRQCIEYIISHLHEMISLQELADIVHLNHAYMSVQFKKITGDSIIDFMNKQRIEEAKFLLEHSDMTLLAISVSLGYSNQGYFTNVFKKIVGMTPLEYRKNIISKKG